LVQLFTQSSILSLQPLLGLFAILNISARSVPTEDFSLIIAHRIATPHLRILPGVPEENYFVHSNA